MSDITPEVLIGLLPVAGVFLLAGLVKGATGFGLPVVSVTLLPFFLPIEWALAINSMVIVATNLQQIRQGGHTREGFAAAWPMMAGMTLMVPVGAQFAAGLDAATLTAILGVFVIVFVVSNFIDPGLRTPPAHAQKVGFGMGLVSGVVGGLTSAPGPIFVSYIVSLHLPRPVFMTALGFIMALFGAAAAVSYVWVGVLRSEHILPGLAAIPFAIGGMWLGNAWAKRLAVDTFRKVVLVLLGVLALLLIRRSIF